MKLDPGYYLLFFFPVQLKPSKLWDKGVNEISRYFWRRKCNIVEIIAKYFVETFETDNLLGPMMTVVGLLSMDMVR